MLSHYLEKYRENNMDVIICFQQYQLGFKNGPLISDEKGKLLSSRAIDDMLTEILSGLFEEREQLFPGDSIYDYLLLEV